MPDVEERVVEEALAHALVNEEVGSTRVVSTRVRPDVDSEGEPALLIILTLNDPPKELETWPVDDTWQLRRLVRDVVSRLGGLDLSWFIFFEPEHPEELEPSDLDEQIIV